MVFGGNVQEVCGKGGKEGRKGETQGRKGEDIKNYFGHLEEAAKIQNKPTLLIRGALSDVLTEEDKDYFLEIIPHAEFEEIEDAAHMVAGDKNDIFSSAVESFLIRNN